VTKADLEAENAKLKAELAKLHGRSRSPCRADVVADSTPSRRAEALGFVPAISSPNQFLLHGNQRQAARRHETLELFLHISTDEVYGDCSAQQASEETILQPTNPYAASKAAAETLVKAYTHSLKLPCTIVRLNNVYGPRQHVSKVIPRFSSMAFQGSPLPLHGSGGAKRRFIHASDAVLGHLQAMDPVTVCLKMSPSSSGRNNSFQTL
jgi:hypothetical protein